MTCQISFNQKDSLIQNMLIYPFTNVNVVSYFMDNPYYAKDDMKYLNIIVNSPIFRVKQPCAIYDTTYLKHGAIIIQVPLNSQKGYLCDTINQKFLVHNEDITTGSLTFTLDVVTNTGKILDPFPFVNLVLQFNE